MLPFLMRFTQKCISHSENAMLHVWFQVFLLLLLLFSDVRTSISQLCTITKLNEVYEASHFG